MIAIMLILLDDEYDDHYIENKKKYYNLSTKN